jgi:hypothetical protein
VKVHHFLKVKKRSWFSSSLNTCLFRCRRCCAGTCSKLNIMHFIQRFLSLTKHRMYNFYVVYAYCLIVGDKTSPCGSGTIIGPNTGVYIGGLPSNFVIRRNQGASNSDPRLTVNCRKTCFGPGCF